MKVIKRLDKRCQTQMLRMCVYICVFVRMRLCFQCIETRTFDKSSFLLCDFRGRLVHTCAGLVSEIVVFVPVIYRRRNLA